MADQYDKSDNNNDNNNKAVFLIDQDEISNHLEIKTSVKMY